MLSTYIFISGAISLACWVAGLYFLKFWSQTRDRFFQVFAFAFWMLGMERAIPFLSGVSDEPQTFVYVIRLAAFSLIFLAIVLKNRRSIQ